MIRCFFILTLLVAIPAAVAAQPVWVQYPIDGTIPITAIEIMSGDSIIVGDAMGGLLLLDRRGAYARVSIDPTKPGLPVSFILRTTHDILFAGLVPGYVYRSLDAGRSWAPVDTLLSASMMARSSDGTLMAIGGRALVSSDDGVHWSPLAAFPAPGTQPCSLIGGEAGSFLVGFEGKGLFISRDGGGTWKSAGLAGTTPCPIVTGGGRIFAATGVILDSTRPIAIQASADAGVSWRTLLELPATQQEKPVVVTGMMMTSTGTVIIGMDIGRRAILQSTDNGESWIAADEGLHDTVATAMKSGPDGVAILATSDGGLYHRSPTSSVAAPSSSLDTDIFVWPDPLSAASRVAFTLHAASRVRVTLFDVLQRRTHVIAEGRFGAGNHFLLCAPGDIPSGTYYVVVETDDGVRARKVMIAR